MNGRFLAALLAPVALATGLLARQATNVPPPPPEGVDVQARGPVHEAFAEPIVGNPQPPPIVAQQPPEPINEMPPEAKPEGDEVLWIPGYWDWEDDDQQFVWVSGFWRENPPSRKWVPGFWQQVDNGWQRMRGFWAPEDQEQFDYLPAPPPTLERGPSSAQPDPQSTYVPGCWLYEQRQYFWRPGFWVPARPGWVWVPACYLWTPAGCLFVEGHWDHPLHERGLLFAPVRFAPGLLGRGFTYVPNEVVRSDFLLSALFVRPAARGYCFGDYFEERLARHYIPWVDYQPMAHVVDPNFGYYRHQFSQEPAWEKNLRGLYTARYQNLVPRPPRTLVQQTQVLRQLTASQQQNAAVNPALPLTRVQNIEVLAPLKQLHGSTTTGLALLAGPKAKGHPSLKKVVQLETLSKEHRTMAHQSANQLREAAQKRQQAETRILTQEKPPRPMDPPRTLKLEVPKVHAAPSAPTHPATPGQQPVPPPSPKRPKETPPAVHPPPAQPPHKDQHPGPTPPTPPVSKEKPAPPKAKENVPPVPHPPVAPPPKPKEKPEPPPKPKEKKDPPKPAQNVSG